MTIRSCLPIDRTQQIELFDNRRRTHVELSLDDFGDAVGGDFTGAEGIDHHRNRVCHSDGVGQLDFTLASQAGSNNIFRHVAGHVGGTAIDLAWVFTAEGATTVGTLAAVGINNDLAPGQTTVAHGATDDKAPGRVDQVAGFTVDQFGRQVRLDNLFENGFLEVVIRHIRNML